MTTQRPKRQKKRHPRVTSAGASWVALVAATTVGLGSIQRVRAAVSADPSQLAESREGYRLIVQSYPRASLTRGELPGSGVRPIASTQRAITPQELGRGVAVDVVGIGAENDAPLIVAWVESGRADLDYDALEARPQQDAYYGVAATTESAEARAVASVVLRRRPGA